MTELERILSDALRSVRADLWLQIEAKHGPNRASEYPTVVRADAALEAVSVNEHQAADHRKTVERGLLAIIRASCDPEYGGVNVAPIARACVAALHGQFTARQMDGVIGKDLCAKIDALVVQQTRD